MVLSQWRSRQRLEPTKTRAVREDIMWIMFGWGSMGAQSVGCKRFDAFILGSLDGRTVGSYLRKTGSALGERSRALLPFRGEICL